jgi:Subtilase family
MTRSFAGFALRGSFAALAVALGFVLGTQAHGDASRGDAPRQGPALAPGWPGEPAQRVWTERATFSGEPGRPNSAVNIGTDGSASEVLVVGTVQGLREEVARLGLRVVEHVELGAIGADLYRVSVPQGRDVSQAMTALRARFPEAGIDFDRMAVPAAATMSSGIVSDSWARSAIGWAPVAPDCGHGIRIGMIDASVDVTHPALAGQDIEFRSFHNPKRRPSEAVHGTAIAAMLVGHPSHEGWGGILPGAELKAANVFEYNEEGRLVGNAVALLEAFDWMVDEGVQVVNLSMAGQDNKALRYVIEHARNRGLVSVAAAGNWGRVEPTYPAAYKDVIAVTAFGRDGRLYDKANRGSFIDFAAPGVEVWTAVPHGGRVQSGTSFAVPYVTAQIAVEVAHGAAKDADSLRRLLESRVTDMGAPGRDDDYGWGFVAGAPSCS